eukprot:8246712-Ditylum_brightwellii.AAC.1
MKKTPGQRYAPTMNIEATIEKTIQSVDVMIKLHHAIKEDSLEEYDEMYYFSKSILIFSRNKYGVHHASDSLSQHLIVMGAAVGTYPLSFAMQGQIGDTKCCNYMLQKYNLFNSSAAITFADE